ncbi:penicillin-binding transpeptidase domain-containing protein [Roseibium salinum]|nr:penicillin-binding transpeptidase domain-containing protein [Roseibium salinum]
MTMVSEPESFLQVRRAQPRIARGSVSSSAVKSRVYVAMLAFACVYAAIAGRLVLLAQMDEAPSTAWISAQDTVAASRPDLVDRNGEILATDIKTASLYAEPRRILDVDEAVEGLIRVLPQLDETVVRRRLDSGAGFAWLQREITPQQAERIHDLGLPGIGFLSEKSTLLPRRTDRRPHRRLGECRQPGSCRGRKKYIDEEWLSDLQSLGFASDRSMEPVRLSVDLRVQHVVRDELAKAMERYRAIAAVGIVLDAKTGEVVAMSSLPDYDPNDRSQALEKDRLNRATGGVFEMGSVFKTFTTAMALDSGAVSINDSFDATRPIRAGGRTISDFHGKKPHPLRTGNLHLFLQHRHGKKMMLATGIDRQKEFLTRLHLTERLKTELPEKRGALAATEMERTGGDHDLVRPWYFRHPDADGRCRSRAREWRDAPAADLRAA